MKKKSAIMNPKNKKRIIRTADALLSVTTLLVLFSTVAPNKAPNASLSTGSFFVYLLLALSYLLQAFDADKSDRNSRIKNICFAALLTVAGTVALIIGGSAVSLIILTEAFLSVALTNRVLAVTSEKKLSIRLVNILLAMVFLFLMVSIPFYVEINTKNCLMINVMLIFGRALGHIIFISFSQMRFRILRKVIRKTYAAEILSGLILLILSFSFVFQAFEHDISGYFDALWYCFAVVTTIGFGDVTVVSPFSRVLSIILGVYGIVVVAMITSVIVNFYNEVRNEKSDDDSDESDADDTK